MSYSPSDKGHRQRAKQTAIPYHKTVILGVQRSYQTEIMSLSSLNGRIRGNKRKPPPNGIVRGFEFYMRSVCRNLVPEESPHP